MADECTRREFQWILTEEVPTVISQVQALLSDCLTMLQTGKLVLNPNVFLPSMTLPPRPQSLSNDNSFEDTHDITTGAPTTSKNSNTTVTGPRKSASGATTGSNDLPVRLAQEHGGASVGVVRLVDTSLTSLKMSWHIPRCGKAAAMHLETQLHKGVTLSVEQLRAATNKVKLSLQEIKRFRLRMDRQNRNMRAASASSPPVTVLHCACDDPAQLVAPLLELLTAAKESLTTAQQRHCERGVLKREMFNPPLPRDVLIDSFLDHGEICIEATIMCECSGFQSSHAGLTPRRVGSVFQDTNGRWLEVASLQRAFGLVPHLSEVLKNLGILVECTQKLQDKLSVFRGLSLLRAT